LIVFRGGWVNENDWLDLTNSNQRSETKSDKLIVSKAIYFILSSEKILI